ncbi:GNAT family N-acetyltransferase [Gammaproteobacteria bacterium]|nr:GNAT family N-acetyltransferase [Gammaproteobacteria bacterium]
MTEIKFIVRPLAGNDFEAVIELDRISGGSSRRGFFEKRERAMEHDPNVFIGLVACADGQLVGFVTACILYGEFGGDKRVAVLDALAVTPDHRGSGVGHRLLQELIGEVRQRGGRELQTQAEWNQPGLVDFFNSVGFILAPRLVLERSTEDVGF